MQSKGPLTVGDFVRHQDGTTGEIERIEGAYVVLKNDTHRYAVRLLERIQVGEQK